MRKQVTKTQLPYLLQEALQVGEWNLVTTNKNHEKYQRAGASIEIGTKALNSTVPASYVFRLHSAGAWVNKAEKLPDLCRRLAQKK
jgi:hypothetical protein